MEIKIEIIGQTKWMRMGQLDKLHEALEEIREEHNEEIYLHFVGGSYNGYKNRVGKLLNVI